MNAEDVIRTQLHETSHQIPLRPLNIDALVRTARGGERVRRAALAVAVAACLGIGVVGITSLVAGRGPKGERVAPPVGPAAGALSAADARDLVERFIERLEAGDAEGARDLLTPAARARTGRDALLEELRPLRTFLSWIPSPRVDVTVTTLSTGIGVRHVATFTAPIEGERPLLQPMVIEVVDGQPLLDLPSATLTRDISLEPEAPQFFACTSDFRCNPWDLWPPVSDGDTFSVLLSPVADVRAAWFSVGGDTWVARASLNEAGDSVRAQATFDATGTTEGIHVFVVAIETTDGVLQTYGYRVGYGNVD